MKVDLSQLKLEVEEELKAIEERKAVLARSLEQITAVEALVAYRRDGDEKITLTRFPHFEKALEESSDPGRKDRKSATVDEEDEPQVRIEWIQAG